MEVVEEPVRRGRHELSTAYVVAQNAIRSAQQGDVVLEPRTRIAGATPWIGVDGESGRKRKGALLEPLDAQELVSQRLLGRTGVTSSSQPRN